MPKYENKACDDSMTFEDCELAILRKAVDDNEKLVGRETATNPDVIKIIQILEDFLKVKQVICYGGTAINNILPKDEQFYNRDIEVPDYDFYSKMALDTAIELANIYYDAGYKEVEAKAGVHYGTYKVYVNFMAVADITQLESVIFDELLKDSIKIAGISYASPDFLRMGMYLELSRPHGDVSRWEKVYKRLSLLNKHYPIKLIQSCNGFQRKLSYEKLKSGSPSKEKTPTQMEEEVFNIVRDELISQGAVFFGGYACNLYSKYTGKNTPDFDVLVKDIDRVSLVIRSELKEQGYKNIELIEHANVGEIVPRHIQIKLGKETIAFLYEPNACHGYNTFKLNQNQIINIATIDTILTLYLAFMYANKEYYDKNRLKCIAKMLFELQEKNKLSQKGILRRFPTKCYGTQKTLEIVRTEKAEMYKKYGNNKKSREYDEWFLNYKPIMGKRKTKTTPPLKSYSIIKSKNAKKMSKTQEKTKTKTEEEIIPIVSKSEKTKTPSSSTKSKKNWLQKKINKTIKRSSYLF